MKFLYSKKPKFFQNFILGTLNFKKAISFLTAWRMEEAWIY